MTNSVGTQDLVVVGGGIGGLAAAALASRRGLRATLLEAHTKLGGCAGYFSRGLHTFDAGATALMGLKPGEPIRDLLDAVGVDLEGVVTPEYRVHLPDRDVAITADAATFEREILRAFPGHDRERRAFWRLQEAVGNTLFRAASGLPRLPIRTFSDIPHNLSTLGIGGLLAGLTSLATVRDVMNWLGLYHERAFRCFVAMLLQDTAQAGPESVPFANAAACLQAYRLGMSRPRGGMKALAEGLGSAIRAHGGEASAASLVDRVEPGPDGNFVVTTRRGRRIVTRHVVFNLPLDLAARLLGRGLEGRLAAKERQSRAAWSAFTGYLAIRREAVPDDGPLFHQVLQRYDRPIHDGNNVLISLSPVGDEGHGPSSVRVATLSTHARPSEWAGLDRASHEAKKADYRGRLLSALGRALPAAPSSLVHAEFASPRSFERYTRRAQGAVGGPPVSRRNANFLAVGADVLGPGLWVVGDSVFPGQGTMAVVLSAMGVVERITGQPWRSERAEA